MNERSEQKKKKKRGLRTPTRKKEISQRDSQPAHPVIFAPFPFFAIRSL